MLLARGSAGAVMAALGWLTLATAAAAQPLTIAAASDLQGVLPEVVSRFERDAGAAVRVTYGSSGNFFAQIRNGAPFDLFLSADIDYPRQLERTGLGVPDTLHEYAIGQLVLWTTTANRALIANGLRGLGAANIRRVAIANPEHAPYGRAAVAALKSAGIYDQVQPKLVLGENISQAAQFVQSGNAQVGIIARSVAMIPAVADGGVAIDLPAGTYPPIEQAAIVMRASKNQAAARRFLDYLTTPAIAALMRQFGFVLPPVVP